MTVVTSARLVREFPARYRLEGARCGACGHIAYPARVVCPACRGTKHTPTTVASSGKVVTFTVIHVAGSAFRLEVPFVLGVVELADGVRTTCQIVDVDPDKVSLGMEVRLEFRRIQEDGEAGVIAYGHKAVPAS
jgi:uncharacterized OB-fold protein